MLECQAQPRRGGPLPVIAHLSDTHLDESSARLRRLQAVLNQVADLGNVDALLVSGDIADHGDVGEYEQFFAALPGLPTLVVPGNHDLSAPLLAAMRAHGHPPSLNATLDVGGLLLVGLDSHLDRNDHGELGSATVEYAHEQLSGTDDPAVLVMHHPPVPIGHHVMDRFGLANGDVLAAIIHAHENVVGVFTGHVHTAVATAFAGVPLLGAPGIVSTMRLGSKTDPIADPDAMPGLAVHTVDGATIRTVFHYLSPSAL
ncbi:metallophosphoesterase family protein [Agromyces laixinhei]|uniref:metallophosphoesterase family protein n=1 Tax=Agromyces laixinhei TaxID=2585717 RepID=UPI0011167492|nr:metallophosphoesterase [Agromyces laixinhei]